LPTAKLHHLPNPKDHTTLTDEELLHAYRAGGDNQWLGHLLQRYTTLLLGVAYKYLKDKALAEDAVQQVFEKVLIHLPKEEILNFKGWLYVLMRNHCLQQLRNKTYLADEAALAYVPDKETNKEEALWHEHTLEQMGEAMKMLNEEQQKTLKLFYLDKRSYEQIIETTGYTFMQVKSYIQNGKRNLKTILLKKMGSGQQ
jgi:RNA polymerase sigma factor (sigma-70 family)